jgi:nucleoside-diphosphate-sugar epimerase
MVKKKEAPICLVTGATTSLGRHLIQKLIKNGYQVRVVLKSQPKEDDQDWRKLPSGVIPYVADLTFKNAEDIKNLESACKGVEKVFHVAGASYNATSSYNKLIETNVIGTENLLKKCIEVNSQSTDPIQFLYTSSITVYGYRRSGELLNEKSSTKPGSHYSESKLMAEHVIQSFAETHSKLRYTILRLGTIYGPGYEKPSFFKAFKLIREGRMRYVGNGSNHLTLIHVDDAANALVLAAQNLKIAGNSIYNVTDGVPHTVVSLFSLAAKLMGVNPPSKKVNPTLARIMRKAVDINYDEYEFLSSDRIVDISKIKRDLGFLPHRKVEIDGALMVEDFMSEYKTPNIVKNK